MEDWDTTQIRRKIARILITNPATSIKITKEGRVIMPLTISFETPRMPLSMALMAGGMTDIAEVKIIDAVNENLDREQLRQQIELFKPDLTVINCSTPTINEDFAIVRDAKALGSLTAVYGQHVDAIPEEVMAACAELDFCFIREPEIIAGELVRAWNDGQPLETVTGLAYRDQNKTVLTPEHSFVPLEQFPQPARELVNNQLYRLPDGDLYTLILASRGCPFDCPFCIAPNFHGLKIRRRDPVSLVDEVEEVIQTTGIRAFLFQADLFTSDKKWVMDICRLILERQLKIRWICNTRVDSVDEETLIMMKKAGCFLMAVGIESGSPKMLEKLGKNPDVSRIIRLIKTCRKLGIRTNGSFVIGYPGETEETLHQTEKLIKQLPLDFLVLLTATPFPGTRFHNEVSSKESKYCLLTDWEKYCYVDYVVQGGLPEETIKQFSDRLLREYFLSFHYFKLRLADLKQPVRLTKTVWYAMKRLPTLMTAFKKKSKNKSQ